MTKTEYVYYGIALIGVSILALSLVYYVLSILKLAFLNPLINFIKVKLGWKENDKDFNNKNDEKLDNIISEKHSNFNKAILDFLKSFN